MLCIVIHLTGTIAYSSTNSENGILRARSVVCARPRDLGLTSHPQDVEIRIKCLSKGRNRVDLAAGRTSKPPIRGPTQRTQTLGTRGFEPAPFRLQADRYVTLAMKRSSRLC